MKRSKKLLSLVMGMLLAFSLMAVTAAAYDAGHEHDCAMCCEEGIEPYIFVKQCPECGGSAVEETRNNALGQRMSRFVCACGWHTNWVNI